MQKNGPPQSSRAVPNSWSHALGPELWKSPEEMWKECEHPFPGEAHSPDGHPGSYSVCCPSMPTDCHKSCLTCSSSGTCTACQKGLRMNPHGSCLANKKCGPSEYWDEDAPECKPCHTKCFHCTGPAEDQCQTCPRISLLLSELLLLRGGLCVSLPLGNCLAHCLVW